MGEAADPRDGALDPEPEAGVREGAIAPDVEVPLERAARQLVAVDGGLQLRQVSAQAVVDAEAEAA